MKNGKLKEICIQYGITGMTGVLMAFSVIRSYGFSSSLKKAEQYRILADACTIPGVVIFLSGVLALIAAEGAFDGLFYAVSYAVKMFVPVLEKKQPRYADSIGCRQESGGAKRFGFLFVTGAVFLCGAAVFLTLFSAVC